MGNIAFKCPHCSKSLKVPDAHAGKRAKCPACTEALQVPAPVSDSEVVEPAHENGELDLFAGLGEGHLSVGEAVEPEKKPRKRKKKANRVSSKSGNVSLSVIPPEVIREDGHRFPGVAERLEQSIAGHLRSSPEIYANGEIALTFVKYSLGLTSTTSETEIGLEVHGELNGQRLSKIFRCEHKTSAEGYRQFRRIVNPIRARSLEHLEDHGGFGRIGVWIHNWQLDSRINRAIDTVILEVLAYLRTTVGETTPIEKRWNVTWGSGVLMTLLVFFAAWQPALQNEGGISNSKFFLLCVLVVFGPLYGVAGHCLSAITMPQEFFEYYSGGIRLRKFTQTSSPQQTRWLTAAAGVVAGTIAIGVQFAMT